MTLALNAQTVGDEVCLSLERPDRSYTLRSLGCIDPTGFQETFVIDIAELAAGPLFTTLSDDEQLEYLLIGYLDAPAAGDVRASYEGVSVDGRSADPVDGFDGVFVLMSVTALDDTISSNPNVVDLQIIDAPD